MRLSPHGHLVWADARPTLHRRRHRPRQLRHPGRRLAGVFTVERFSRGAAGVRFQERGLGKLFDFDHFLLRSDPRGANQPLVVETFVVGDFVVGSAHFFGLVGGELGTEAFLVRIRLMVLLQD